MKIRKVIFNFIGFMIIMGSLVIMLIIMSSFFIFGGIILYENNIFITILEFVMILYGLFFILIKFRKFYYAI